MSRKRPAWGNGVNLSGLWFSQPVPMERWPYGSYYDATGDFECNGLGQHDCEGCITFLSLDRDEAEAWTEGAKAVMSLLYTWSMVLDD